VDAHHSASLSSSNYTRTAATTMQQPHRLAKTDSEATFSMAAYYVQSPGHDDKTAAAPSFHSSSSSRRGAAGGGNRG
jgi:hypothetical protein